MPECDTMLLIEHLKVSYGHGSASHQVISNLSLEITRGETMGLVGESGSGKSTLAKVLVGVVAASSGRVEIDGVELGSGNRALKKRQRRLVQMIPQDPYSSLNPRMTIGQAVAEALDPSRANVQRSKERIAEWLDLVRLNPDIMWRYPHELSGGQRQRIAIARALAVEPSFVVADEITSALDVSVQAEILELFAQIRKELKLTVLFISHNLAVVQQVSDRVAVMLKGDLVEQATVSDLFGRPQHPYTIKLLDSVPGSEGFASSLWSQK